MEEIQLLYGLKNGELTHIDQVESGEKCGCICPACQGTLIARKGEKKRHHFAHKTEENCSHGYETVLHLLAKEILSKASTLSIPPVVLNFPLKESLVLHNSIEIPVVSVELEQKYHPIIPDVVVTSSKNQKLMVEIFVTHKIDEEKQQKIENIGISTIEIDLSAYKESAMTEEILQKILLGESEEKYWIFNKLVAEHRRIFLGKSQWLQEENSEVSCILKQYQGSTESPFVDTDTCYDCPYSWDDSQGILCSGSLRMSKLEQMFSTPKQDMERVRACEKAEADARAKVERERKFQEEKVQIWHKNLNKGICPECGESLRFRRRKSDGHKFLACTSWIDEYEGCQFTLSLDDEDAQATDFVKNHEAWSEKSKIGKAERKCGWCGKDLVHREPKPDSKRWFRPFLSCSGYPYCKFKTYYTSEELRELEEAKED